jgi:hypothetical protein
VDNAHRAGAGSRAGGASRSGTGLGTAGATGGACVGKRIGSTVIRRDGPGMEPKGKGASGRGMEIT